MAARKCTTCKKSKPLGDFQKTTKKGVMRTLKKCIACRVHAKQWKKDNVDRLDAYALASREGREWNAEGEGFAKAWSGPSARRTKHTTEGGIIGKACCTCRKWTPLDGYGCLASQWDGLRNDCKECLGLRRAGMSAEGIRKKVGI